LKITAYRYPNEHFILALTLFLVLLVIAITATATVCASVIFIALFVIFSYYMTYSHHQDLLRRARRVTARDMPDLHRLVSQTVKRLRPGAIEVFVVPGRVLNAYTFGLSSPKAVVVYAPMMQFMDQGELEFILGHELGHVALGHTWLNSLVGGMAGIPASWSVGAVLTLALLWWNRACEFSADRAGLLACGSPAKAISALVKLGAGPRATSQTDLERVYRQIDAEDDTFLGGLGEILGTHPMLIRRIEALRRYARSSAYHRLQAQINQL
jgi:Zn-dependent protease with chaperone function